MAAPSSLTDHQLLTTTSNGCLETEDVYGDALADIPNIVVFVNLSASTPLLHCISWYDLRGTLEQPGVPSRERVRLWRSDPAISSNYVYRVLDRWFAPSLEPFTRYYNTFLLYDSYEERIGTELAVSALHGATERLHRVRPVHRRDVIDYVRGTLSSGALRERLATTVGGLPDAPGRAPETVAFEPEPEDMVRPAVLYQEERIVITRPFEGKPFGHSTVWQSGQLDTPATYDGSQGIEDLTVIESPSAVPAAEVDAIMAQFNAAIAEGLAEPDAEPERAEIYIPGLHEPFTAVFDARGREIEGNVLPPPAREMVVVVNGSTYHLRPRLTVEGEGDDARLSFTLGDEPPFPYPSPTREGLIWLVGGFRALDTAHVQRTGTLALEFLDGLRVYQSTEPDGTTRYAYIDDGQPSLYPPLATGLWDFTLPGVGRCRVLLDANRFPKYFVHDPAQCRFQPVPEIPAIITALLEANPTVDGIHDRTYVLGALGWYLVVGDTTYSLETGNAAYPFDSERLEVWRDDAYWDYDAETQELRAPSYALTRRATVPAPPALSALLQMLRQPPSFRVRYAAESPVFQVRHAGDHYYSSIVPRPAPHDEPFDATITTIPPLLVRRYAVLYRRTTTLVELPMVLPDTWGELEDDLRARYPHLVLIPGYLQLLYHQYEEHAAATGVVDGSRLLADGFAYEITVTDGVVRLHCDNRVTMPRMHRLIGLADSP